MNYQTDGIQSGYTCIITRGRKECESNGVYDRRNDPREEREKLLAESPQRRRRAAQDSGKTERQVSQVVAQFFEMRVRLKNLMGVMEGGSLPALKNLEEAMNTEQKCSPWYSKEKEKITIKEAICRLVFQA
ncbi:hypothetical protein OROHE_019094 [Orobanche hederae]